MTFLVGDGISPSQEVLTHDAIKEAERSRLRLPAGRDLTKKQEARARWCQYEFARFFTTNVIPPLGYFGLYHLSRIGLVRSIITTNYDLYFNAIAERTDAPWSLNPILSRGQYSWDNYYGRRSSASSRVPVLKIHGSLSHATFTCCSSTECAHIFRLPGFPIYNDVAPINARFGVRQNHDHLGHVGYSDRPRSLAGRERCLASHYLDWAFDNKRDAFAKEIDAARRELSYSSGPVVLLGFTGFFDRTSANPWNEELVPLIEELHRKGRPIFYFIHDTQRKKLETTGSPSGSLAPWCLSRKRYSGQFTDSGSFLLDAIDQAGVGNAADLRIAYAWDWVHGPRFLQPMQLRVSRAP